MDFDRLIAWLDARLGQRVHASMSRPGTDLGMHAGGALQRHVEEIVLIAIESTRWQILGLALLSLGLGGIVLFYSDFTGSKAPRPGTGLMLALSVVSYAVALAVSAFILWFFGRFEGVSLAAGVAQTVTLGVASSLGASAGRLLLLS